VHSVGLYSYMYVQKGCKLSLASFPGPEKADEAKLSHDSQYDSHTVNVHYLTSELNTRMMLMYTCTTTQSKLQNDEDSSADLEF